MTAEVADPRGRLGSDTRSPVGLILLGALCGIAWAAGLRGLMAEVARLSSDVSWSGTFGLILLPGLTVGALLGWAEHLRTTGGRPGWRWLALAPLGFAAAVLADPLHLVSSLRDGGGGAIGFAVLAMAGGFAISGRGPGWGRLVCGVLALLPVPLWFLTVESFAGPDLAIDTPRGLWAALSFVSFLALLYVACAIPHREVRVR